MDEKLGKFIDDFAQLMQIAQSGQHRVKAGRQLLTTITEHLAVPAESLAVVVEEVPAHRFVDADILMAELAAEDAEFRLVGIGGGDQRHHQTLSDMLQQSQFFPQFPLSQPDYINLAVGPEEQRQAVALGLWLFRHAGSPVAVLQRDAAPRYGRQTACLEVLAADAKNAADFLAEFRRRMQRGSVLKGQVISLVMGEYGPSTGGVTFHARPELTASDVILPQGLLQKVTDHALGIAAHRESLKEYGQHLKRGILLYGRPGTGKTHTVRYLLSQSAGITAILLSGGSLARISEAAAMARALQPSIVVLEDCDLIAEDRSFGHGPQPLLFEVLDAMDGLDHDADVAFVLTTNRVDMLERALAQRPGRVDLAVDIPLPAADERVGAGDAVCARHSVQPGCCPGRRRPHRRNNGLVRARTRPPCRRTCRTGRRTRVGQSPARGGGRTDGRRRDPHQEPAGQRPRRRRRGRPGRLRRSRLPRSRSWQAGFSPAGLLSRA
ncbi:ATP-binding protein [Arthrobacter sp. ISL-65]|uniref:ATP-binding protein n=1 Tax=Arthrobacter sp. ISL-65 TaxID=2819112 RepID=UPI0020350172|nr:ATP-binding protein [Arthrobacter sp. ISL-65]